MTPKITIITGCMFSGKTTFIINESIKLSKIGKKILIINHVYDNRYAGNQNCVISHNSQYANCLKYDLLSSVPINLIQSCDIIMIDEAQFFPDLVQNVLNWCEVQCKDVYVAGLSEDYERKKFGSIIDLIPYSDNIIKLFAYCSKCIDPTNAIFTARVSDNKNQILVGHTDYHPVCRYHYLSPL
jgi:thymidine kinase